MGGDLTVEGKLDAANFAITKLSATAGEVSGLMAMQSAAVATNLSVGTHGPTRRHTATHGHARPHTGNEHGVSSLSLSLSQVGDATSSERIDASTIRASAISSQEITAGGQLSADTVAAASFVAGEVGVHTFGTSKPSPHRAGSSCHASCVRERSQHLIYSVSPASRV